MAKKMYADPNKVCIYQGNDSVIHDPKSRLEDVFFHSDLSYLEVVYSPEVRLQLPGANDITDWKNMKEVFYHGLGYTPMVTGYLMEASISLTGTAIIRLNEQNGGKNFSVRALGLFADNYRVYVFDDLWVRFDTVPAIDDVLALQVYRLT